MHVVGVIPAEDPCHMHKLGEKEKGCRRKVRGKGEGAKGGEKGEGGSGCEKD